MPVLEPLPISLVAHTVFCDRRAWLEAVGERVPTRANAAGIREPARIDSRADERLSARRSVDIADESLGLVGRCDVIQSGSSGGVRIVEFKSTTYRTQASVTEAQRIQLALQGMCLESAGYRIDGFAIYFTRSRQIIDVPIGAAERLAARKYVTRTREIIESRRAPRPLDQDPRCEWCSHAPICMPDERDESRVVRRIRVSDPDGESLHLSTPGSRASLSRGRVVVTRQREELGSVPIERVTALTVHGNVDVSAALIRELLWRAIPTVWCSASGKVLGMAVSSASPNGVARVHQHVASARGRLDLVRELIAPKSSNQATQLRRSSRSDVAETVKRIRASARAIGDARTKTEAFGYEGEAASLYFGGFSMMFAKSADSAITETWTGRHGRGAIDPVNVALNLAYALLVSDMSRAVLACGLDPHAGFVHSSSRNKPALVLDLIEQFRPLVADSAVLSALNNRELRESSFVTVLGGWRLRDSGRKAIIAAYERRVSQTFRHPVFGYDVTWRRAMEVQARMLLGVLDGTQDRYVGIRTR